MGSVIVTIINKGKTMQIDMEIPLSTHANKLPDHIIEIINMAFPQYAIEHGINLVHLRTGRNIVGDQDLEEFGLWNGDYLMITGGKQDAKSFI